MFNYQQAFSRNIGWVTEQEQQKLRQAKVAIAGAGGVGSAHLLTLTRLGISHFNISDFDQFEVHNFNRQAGAMMSTIDQDKVEVMERLAKDINPELTINSYPEGIDESNVEAFLDGVDLYVDSLDFFALSARKLVFAVCTRKKIPIVTAAPLGMGSAVLCFMPGQMDYEQYFCFEGRSELDQYIQFLIGLSPSMLQMPYLVDKSRVDFKARKGPSTIMGVQLCAGMASTFALKILLGRGDVIAAPYGLHFDAYRNKLKKTWRPFGNRGLLPRLMFAIAKRVVTKEQAVKSV
ncbi:ThiF family adenylyltransferase [Alkalimonas collagenimarina]|uniref:ThiF family adenylyltransferase n=1 Tax=Alkalimonas collagenimarina TaxID=400390 RepID=A0ABT9GZ47_9GAMM|nr:ThiF family adenylyltransferase [Alkalimonas collagenimarina]MDP4536345.1 ThiF family adenylyltransferase [Alkalimonas collagenimarina]